MSDRNHRDARDAGLAKALAEALRDDVRRVRCYARGETPPHDEAVLRYARRQCALWQAAIRRGTRP